MDTIIAILLVIQPAGEPEAVKVAQKKLETSPDDARANQVVGLYLLGRRDEKAIDHLKKASDPSLKRAATLEAEDPLKAAKAWMTSKVFVARERASTCLERAWTAADDSAPLRAKLLEFAAPPTGYQKFDQRGPAAGWWPLTDEFGCGVDSKFAWSGSKSLKLLPTKGGKVNPDAWSSAETLNFPLGQAKRVTASAWIFAYETDFGGQLDIHFRDAAGKRLSTSGVPVLQDQPFWRRYEVSADVPAGATLVSMRIDVKITKGAAWCDEIDMTDGARDLFMGGGFER